MASIMVAHGETYGSVAHLQAFNNNTIIRDASPAYKAWPKSTTGTILNMPSLAARRLYTGACQKHSMARGISIPSAATMQYGTRSPSTVFQLLHAETKLTRGLVAKCF